MTNGRSSECYFCDEQFVLERHHVVPRRFGGSDSDENLVTVCPTCHEKLEKLYDKRFYEGVGADRPAGGEDTATTDNGEKIVDCIEFLRYIGDCIGKETRDEVGKYAVCVESSGIVKLRIRLQVAYKHVRNHAEVSDNQSLLDLADYRTSLKEDTAAVTEGSIGTRFENAGNSRAMGFDTSYIESYLEDFPLEQVPGYAEKAQSR